MFLQPNVHARHITCIIKISFFSISMGAFKTVSKTLRFSNPTGQQASLTIAFMQLNFSHIESVKNLESTFITVLSNIYYGRYIISFNKEKLLLKS